MNLTVQVLIILLVFKPGQGFVRERFLDCRHPCFHVVINHVAYVLWSTKHFKKSPPMYASQEGNGILRMLEIWNLPYILCNRDREGKRCEQRFAMESARHMGVKLRLVWDATMGNIPAQECVVRPLGAQYTSLFTISFPLYILRRLLLSTRLEASSAADFLSRSINLQSLPQQLLDLHN